MKKRIRFITVKFLLKKNEKKKERKEKMHI